MRQLSARVPGGPAHAALPRWRRCERPDGRPGHSREGRRAGARAEAAASRQKELCWRTGSSVRSLLSWTNWSSAPRARRYVPCAVARRHGRSPGGSASHCPCVPRAAAANRQLVGRRVVADLPDPCSYQRARGEEPCPSSCCSTALVDVDRLRPCQAFLRMVFSNRSQARMVARRPAPGRRPDEHRRTRQAAPRDRDSASDSRRPEVTWLLVLL